MKKIIFKIISIIEIKFYEEIEESVKKEIINNHTLKNKYNYYDF